MLSSLQGFLLALTVTVSLISQENNFRYLVYINYFMNFFEFYSLKF